MANEIIIRVSVSMDSSMIRARLISQPRSYRLWSVLAHALEQAVRFSDKVGVEQLRSRPFTFRAPHLDARHWGRPAWRVL